MKKNFLVTALIYACIFSFHFSSDINAQPYKWQSLKMGGAGFVSGIIMSKQEPNLRYARTDVGGAYKWDVPSATWIPLQDQNASNQSGFYGVESLAIDPRATNKVYMLVGINYFDNGKTAILKSDNYGQTFTTIETSNQFKAHGNGMGRSNGERLQVDPNLGTILYVGTRYNGLFKSTDAGLTWARLTGLNLTTTPNGNGISFVIVDPASGTNGVASQVIYVGVSRYASVGENLYKSTDGGVTFIPVTGGPAAYMPQRAQLLGNGTMLINYANGSGPFGTTVNGSAEPMSNGAIMKYNITGNTWTNITPSGIARAWGGLSVDPNNPNRIIASTINNYQSQLTYPNGTGGTTTSFGDRFYLTTNGGTTWRDVVNPGYTLNTNGIPWITTSAIHWAGCIEFDPFNTNRVFVTSGNGIFSNENIDMVGSPWKFDVNGLEETVPYGLVSIPDGPLFTTVADYDGFKYTDINQYGERLTPTMGTTRGLAYAALNPYILARVGTRIYVTTNQGATWTQTAAAMGPAGNVGGRIAISADGITMLHCPETTTTTATYYSTNKGAGWTPCSGLALSNAIPVADMVNPNKFYVYNSGTGGAFYVTNNGGASFEVTANLPSGGSRLIRTIPGQEGHIWVAMFGNGLRRSVNSGTSFTTVGAGTVTRCDAIGYGKAAPGASYLTMYMWGTVSGVTGIFRSINEGASWVRINDDTHQFGGPGNGQFVMGDMNTYGTVYMSTVGRGIIAGQINTPLPVALASLNVKEAVQSGKPVAMLSWKTLTENNASHFTIERSANARSWSPVATVATKAINGTSTAALSYTHGDDIIGLSGLVYYRLKSVDKNGAYVYGNTVSLNIGKSVKGLTVMVSPNPVEATTGAVVRFTADKDQKVTVKVLAGNGALLMTKALSLQSGSTTISLTELTNQPSGIYTLSVVTSDSTKSISTIRFVVK